MTVYSTTVAGFAAETTVTDMDGEYRLVPVGGLEVLHVGAPVVLPDGSRLEAGSGATVHVFRQHRHEAAADPAWVGHRFEATTFDTEGDSMVARYMTVPPSVEKDKAAGRLFPAG